MVLLFFTRLALYLLAFLIPIIHPAIVIAYDLPGWWLWFVLIPGEMAIAFFLAPPRLKLKYWLAAALGLLVFSFFISGFGSYFLLFITGGAAAFLLTLLIFKVGSICQAVAVFEQIFILFIYYVLLNFSRASEEIASESSGITQIILLLIVVTFITHGVVLYISAFKGRGGKRGRREAVFLLSFLLPLVLFLVFIIPKNYITHDAIFNFLKQDIDPQTIYDVPPGKGWEDGGSGLNRRRGDREGEDGDGRQGEGREPSLQGVPSDQWGGGMMGMRGEEAKQYAVMLVVSPHDPVYAAEEYFGGFDSQRGFISTTDSELNELTWLRLLETWRDTNPPGDLMRRNYDIFYISTLPKRVVAYRPFRIEPTIRDSRYYPFDFSYKTVSRISVAGPRQLRSIEGLSERERENLRVYLNVSLSEEDRVVFEGYLDSVFKEKQQEWGYFDRIEAILKSFSEYQYELGFTDDVSVSRLRYFLTKDKTGDCTEFSNTAALLGRLAGIPSRVVTGYLASKDLQSIAHRRGIWQLAQVIEPLQEYPIEDIYLVTTSHRHSWVQFYLPDYGWVDFESTAFAIPPPPGGDPNSMDVVIPIIQEGKQPVEDFAFPWGFVLRVLALIAGAAVISLYIYRYGKEIYFLLLSRRNDLKGLKALYRLLLMRLAANGYEVKEPSLTPLEYSEIYPELKHFAFLYTEMRYREKLSMEERAESMERLRAEYREILTSLQNGFVPFFRRIFSLKGLSY